MSWIKKHSPVEFRNIYWKNKVDLCTKLFIGYCTEHDVLVNKKLNPVYWKISKVFKNCDMEQLNIFYDYLYSLDSKTIQTFEQFFVNTEKHRQQLIFEHDKEKMKNISVEQYPDLMDCLKDM